MEDCNFSDSTFYPNAEERVHLYSIGAQMKTSGLNAEFITEAVVCAEHWEGTYDLMVLWEKESDSTERNELVADMQEEMDYLKELPRQPTKKPYIRFESLDEVAKDIMEFKNALREEVDRWGGISKLSQVTGIPQPSLSRFFHSASMPRRTTLYKIADAMQLEETYILSKWVR